MHRASACLPTEEIVRSHGKDNREKAAEMTASVQPTSNNDVQEPVPGKRLKVPGLNLAISVKPCGLAQTGYRQYRGKIGAPTAFPRNDYTREDEPVSTHPRYSLIFAVTRRVWRKRPHPRQVGGSNNTWLTPLRNRIPRNTKAAGAGDAVHWKAVTAIQGGGILSMGWVPEGQRAPRITVTAEDKSATYVTMGTEADVTMEAQSAAQGFEDIMATTGTRLLQAMMILEEYAILGGNRTVALGTPTAPTVSASTSGGTVPDATYNVAVVALTLEGFLAASLSSGVIQQQTITGMDNATYTLNGGSSNKSSTTSTGALSGSNTNVIYASTPVIKGAVAYAWYVGTAGNEKLEAITTINSMSLTALAGTGQALTAITADRSKNATLAYDGLLYSAFGSASAYYSALATGAMGVGTTLTASGNGSITEIDAMFKAFWDNHRLSPEELYVNAQELDTITKLTLSNGSNALIRFNYDVSMENPSMIAGATVGFYFNRFSMNGGQLVPVKLHPNLPAGTIFTWAQNLPAHYIAANVPQTAGVQCRRDYYQIPWPLITRANQTGVYCEEVLKV